MTGVVAVPPPTATDLGSPGERGTTTVADRVVVAVAARAAADVPGIGGVARRAVRLPGDMRRPGRGPQVEATVSGETVTVRLRLSVIYPGPVRAVTEEVRRHVAETVGVLTGKRVVSMDVTVVSLPLPVAAPRVVR
jgi:uncharacterized alkaline shock family protein YloU